MLTLAIESAIAGGSLSLLSGVHELDSRIGGDKVSRAEELLPNIIQMLKDQGLEPKALGRIAVSVGPGSFTGIRIGIATALGLKNSLDIQTVGLSALEAMAASASEAGRLVAAVPVGRDLICSQIFDIDDSKRAIAVSGPVVTKSIIDPGENVVILAHEAISDSVRNDLSGREVIIVDRNLAFLLGRATVLNHGDEGLKPIFVQPV